MSILSRYQLDQRTWRSHDNTDLSLDEINNKIDELEIAVDANPAARKMEFEQDQKAGTLKCLYLEISQMTKSLVTLGTS